MNGKCRGVQKRDILLIHRLEATYTVGSARYCKHYAATLRVPSIFFNFDSAQNCDVVI